MVSADTGLWETCIVPGRKREAGTGGFRSRRALSKDGGFREQGWGRGGGVPEAGRQERRNRQPPWPRRDLLGKVGVLGPVVAESLRSFPPEEPLPRPRVTRGSGENTDVPARAVGTGAEFRRPRCGEQLHRFRHGSRSHDPNPQRAVFHAQQDPADGDVRGGPSNDVPQQGGAAAETQASVGQGGHLVRAGVATRGTSYPGASAPRRHGVAVLPVLLHARRRSHGTHGTAG